MTIKILSAKEFATKLKATIQASGDLAGETAIALNLKVGKFAKFAKDDENDAAMRRSGYQFYRLIKK